MAIAMDAGQMHNPRYQDSEATEGSRTYAMFMHIVSALVVIDISGVLVFIASLIMWLVKRGDSDFIDDHGREAVNFQISMLLFVILGVIAGVVFSIVTFGVGVPIVVLLGAAGALFLIVLRLVGTIRGAIAASKGELYRYPMCIRCIPEPRDA